MAGSSASPIFRYDFTIPPEAVDQNGHVNNVVFVQWMQEAAMQHFEFLGGVPPMLAAHGTWYVRSHKIEYLQPAFVGERLEVRTWIAGVRRVRSLRKYEFRRRPDDQLLVQGETDWVFIDAGSGRPMAIPPEVLKLFPAPAEPGGAGEVRRTNGLSGAD
jgi:acyl-CoA thioester hydrolase